MSDNYVLDANGNAVRCDDILEWARWFHKADRHVAQDTIGEVLISTVFLGIDHAFGYSPAPILWETMIFRGKHDGYQERFTSREEAIAGHAAAVALVKADA